MPPLRRLLWRLFRRGLPLHRPADRRCRPWLPQALGRNDNATCSAMVDPTALIIES